MNEIAFSVNHEIERDYLFLSTNPFKSHKIGTYYYTIENVNYELLNAYNSLIINQDVYDLSDGIYTWIILSHNGIPGIYLLKTLSIQEIHTKHCNIIEKIFALFPNEKYILHYAGEIYKKTENITVNNENHNRIHMSMNFASGSYMAGNIQKSNRSTYVKEVLNFMTNALLKPEFCFIEFMDEDTLTFIKDTNLNLCVSDINIYLKCGAKIHRFDDLAEYKSYVSAINKNETLRNRYNYYMNIYEINKKTKSTLLVIEPPNEPSYFDENIGTLITEPINI
jgi:hypothetical protein